MKNPFKDTNQVVNSCLAYKLDGKLYDSVHEAKADYLATHLKELVYFLSKDGYGWYDAERTRKNYNKIKALFDVEVAQ